MFNAPFRNPRIQSSQEHFAKVPHADIPRSSFNRSHQHKTTFDAGDLIPVFVDEALPGDTFNLRMTSFARLATPIVPIMDNLYADVFFFAVPYRLVWENWERFNGAQDDPGDSTDFLVPVMPAPAAVGHLVGSLSDYMGIPTGIPDLEHVSLFHRAYSLIWNEWFRDENLQNSAVVPKDDGPDTASDFPVQRRGKRHDYFTSALPWPQKGPAILLPLGAYAPVISDLGIAQPPLPAGIGVPTFEYDSFTQTGLSVNSVTPVVTGNQVPPAGGPFVLKWDNTTIQGSGLVTDLGAAVGPDINEFRQAVQLQKLLERDARGGTRYTEIIRSHFGTVSPDFRLQRPEYLGGGSTPVHLSPIPQTSSTDATTPQGNLAAMGTFSHNGVGFTKSFVEHSIIIGLVSVRADLTYQQGLPRMFSRQTRYDFYWPALSHLGEQAILNQEIWAQDPANIDPGTGEPYNVGVFGYQERYAEYRYKPSMITGQFRSTYATPLDMWHLAQEFGTLPVLGEQFIQEAPPISRVIAVPSEPHFLFDSSFHLICARPMPVYSVPGWVDHF